MTTPAPAPIAGAWRVLIKGRQFGQDVVNAFGYIGDTGSTPSTAVATAIASRFAEQWGQNMMARLHASYTVQGAVAYSLQNPAIAGEASRSMVGGLTTADGSHAAPSFVVARVRLSTGLRGRRYSGRTGISGITESTTDGNTLIPGAVQSFGEGFSGFRTGVQTFTGGSGSLAVISETYRLATPVVSHSVDSALGSRITRKG